MRICFYLCTRTPSLYVIFWNYVQRIENELYSNTRVN